MSELTNEQADAIQLYIWAVRDALRLSHWDTFLGAESAPEDANAHVQPTEGRQVAAIHVAADWWENRSPDEKRNDITHELVHLIHRDQSDVIRVGLLRSGHLPKPARRLLWSMFSLATESMVDHLAGVLAPMMPEWTEPKEGTK